MVDYELVKALVDGVLARRGGGFFGIHFALVTVIAAVAAVLLAAMALVFKR